MKQLFFVLVLSVLTITGYAQSNITSLYVPIEDETVAYKLGSNSAGSVGAAGNQNWDFSGVTYLTTTSMSFVDPTFTTRGSMYPSADIAYIDNFGTNYMAWSSTNKTWYGYASTTNTNYTLYSNPINVYTLPLAYNVSSAVDNYAGTKYKGSDTYAITGTSTTTFDGYGSIVTNYGTYTNVVRIKTTMIEQQVKQSNSEITDNTTDVYQWYTSTGKLVYRIDHAVSVSPGLEVEAKFYYSFNIPTTTTDVLAGSNAQQLTAKPNPASENLSLDLSSINSGDYDVSITNSNGNVVILDHVTLVHGDVKNIPVASLSQGVYFLTLVSEREKYVVKFVKQ